MASVYVIRGQDHGQHFVLRGNQCTIGRDSSNQIRLNDSEVSRQHAIISRVSDTDFELRDSGSSNGSYVNSRQVQSVILRTGDRIQIGRTLMLFNGGIEVNSTHSLDAIEIVPASAAAGELSQIRSRAESRASELSVFQESVSGSALESSAHFSAEALNDGEIVYQVSQAISRTVDIGQLLDKVLQLIFQWIECDRGCIMLLDEVTGDLRPNSSRTRRQSKAGSAQARMEISRTILDHVVKQREGVLTSNAQDDARWNQAASIAGLGIREAICVPMQGRYGLVGAIYVDTEMSAGTYAARNGAALFDQSHLKLMIAIAGQAAMAIEDTQFYHAMLQAERLATMGQTIANVSHHVKNILQGISGGNYLVEDGLASDNIEVVKRGWAIVKKNQYRISNLVMDMLSFSKEREPELAQHDVSQIVNDIAELMLSRAVDAGVKLTVSSSPVAIWAMCDSEAIHRALLNVVTNAIDAVATSEKAESDPPQVQIQYELDSSRHRVQIHVIDNGVGIAADQIQRIFAPFHSSKGSRGTGLGLPVSQKVMREHGGDILVQSELGIGSRFTLYWPVGDGVPAPTSATLVTAPLPPKQQ
ncbi:MAG: ATP-binding protein [Pirellulales bacterium]